jgi:hypothetical protein
MTTEVAESPETQLDLLLKNPDDRAMINRFERAKKQERENIKDYISKTADNFFNRSDLKIYEKRMDLIAELYLKTICDINTAFDDFKGMYDQIKLEEAGLAEKLEVKILFDETAVDAIIGQAIKTGQEAGSLALKLASRLEYGLNLVKERAGIDSFIITDEAVDDMEKFINRFIKEFYRHDYPTDDSR